MSKDLDDYFSTKLTLTVYALIVCSDTYID